MTLRIISKRIISKQSWVSGSKLYFKNQNGLLTGQGSYPDEASGYPASLRALRLHRGPQAHAHEAHQVQTSPRTRVQDRDSRLLTVSVAPKYRQRYILLIHPVLVVYWLFVDHIHAKSRIRIQESSIFFTVNGEYFNATNIVKG